MASRATHPPDLLIPKGLIPQYKAFHTIPLGLKVFPYAFWESLALLRLTFKLSDLYIEEVNNNTPPKKTRGSHIHT